MKKLFLILIIFSWISRAGAQYFQTGEDPASIKWRQINTENFQLIFPDYFEQQAQKLAGVLEEVYKYGGYSLDHEPKKISVILHTQTVQSNGLVGWAPKRAEFYTTPHQSIYPQDWLEQLALHEFRHVVQVDKLNENLPGLIKAILGEQGTALVFGAHLPWWFIEGDAVVTETALGKYGRGRLPSFLMEHQAQVVEKGIFSYDKAYFGSFDHFVPNHYKLGYYLVGGSRVQYGSSIWKDVIATAGRKPITFFPINRVLKYQIGLTKRGLYYSVFDSLQSNWIKKDQNYISDEINILSPSKEIYTNYIYNYWYNDSTLISYKTSFNTIPEFVKIDVNGNEERIFRPGAIFRESANYRDDIIVWSEQIPDVRWTHSGKSLLRFYQIESENIFEFYTEFKAFSPSVSLDKSKVAVVETDFSNNYYLSVYQLPAGNLLNRFQTKENNYFFSPDWLNDNELVTVVLTSGGKRLAKVNLSSNDYEIILDQDLGEVKHLRAKNEKLYFISSYSGKNSLYTYNFSNRSVNKLFEPRFGVESPAISANGEKLALSDYTSDGFRIIQIENANNNHIPLNEVPAANYEMADLLAGQEKGMPDFSGLEHRDFPSKKYSKPLNILNFHSWAPFFIDVDSYDFWPGASIMSQNKLGTAETIFGYRYYTAEKTGQFFAGYKFKGWYPVFDFELRGGRRASEYTLINQFTNNQGEVVRQDTSIQRFTWGETDAGINVHVPLNFTKGIFQRRLQPEVRYNFTSYKHNESTYHAFFQGKFHSTTYRLYYHQLLRQSYRDVFPDFGFVLDFTFRNSPFGAERFGERTTAQSILYLPGILKNHGLKFYGGYQTKKLNGMRSFSDVIRYPRGWGRTNTRKMYSASADYKMPLIYPDWNLAGLLYVRRASISLFADVARLKGNAFRDGVIAGTFTKDISSFGSELTFDVNILRFYAPANVGVRTSYLPEMKQVYFDFLFSINFQSF